jgi:hypothetical protein
VATKCWAVAAPLGLAFAAHALKDIRPSCDGVERLCRERAFGDCDNGSASRYQKHSPVSRVSGEDGWQRVQVSRRCRDGRRGAFWQEHRIPEQATRRIEY